MNVIIYPGHITLMCETCIKRESGKHFFIVKLAWNRCHCIDDYVFASGPEGKDFRLYQIYPKMDFTI